MKLDINRATQRDGEDLTLGVFSSVAYPKVEFPTSWMVSWIVFIHKILSYKEPVKYFSFYQPYS